MHYKWIDYPAQFEKRIEGWCDQYAMQIAMEDDTAKVENQWYLATPDTYTHIDYNKIALEGDTPIALLMMVVIKEKSIVHFDTLIVNPKMRKQGHGVRALTDVLQNAEAIIGVENPVFVGQIRKDNNVSIRLMEKLGFQCVDDAHKRDDAWCNWVYPAGAAASFDS
ncbi:MAG: GNAT family N-acetyltransferase [Defluviitaleaceae bacterium]|nr:GNAT family N-acetyltransferase [Defluviitaleaceae bacterium]MCL2273521.1 GNAT family N-acetyltransferase [Defluviitaleaceae bacterium]